MIYDYRIVAGNINAHFGKEVFKTKLGLLSPSESKKLNKYILLFNDDIDTSLNNDSDRSLWKSWDDASYSIKSTICHIRINRIFLGGIPYTHHGIYNNDYEVYHFDTIEKYPDTPSGILKKFNNNDIICTDISKFQEKGYRVEYYNVNSPYSDYEIIERARSKEGACKGKYDLIEYNCEHFANWCYLGESKSLQVEMLKLLTDILGALSNK